MSTRHERAIGVAAALADFHRRFGTLRHAEAMGMIRDIDDLVGRYDEADDNRLIWPRDIAAMAGVTSRGQRQSAKAE